MSDLKPGDLAIVIRTHCSAQDRQVLGHVVTVQRLVAPPGYGFCGTCLGEIVSSADVLVDDSSFRFSGIHIWPVAWLKKIEPLSDRERLADEFTYAIDRQLADPIKA